MYRLTITCATTRYAPERATVKKTKDHMTSPQLVPYSFLTEKEKASPVKSAQEMVRMILYSGQCVCVCVCVCVCTCARVHVCVCVCARASSGPNAHVFPLSQATGLTSASSRRLPWRRCCVKTKTPAALRAPMKQKRVWRCSTRSSKASLTRFCFRWPDGGLQPQQRCALLSCVHLSVCVYVCVHLLFLCAPSPFIVQALLASRSAILPQINCVDELGRTPLYTAVRHRHRRTAMVLIEFNANLEIADNFNVAILSLAAFQGDVRMCKLLLSHGARYMDRDSVGMVRGSRCCCRCRCRCSVARCGASSLFRCVADSTPLRGIRRQRARLFAVGEEADAARRARRRRHWREFPEN